MLTRNAEDGLTQELTSSADQDLQTISATQELPPRRATEKPAGCFFKQSDRFLKEFPKKILSFKIKNLKIL